MTEYNKTNAILEHIIRYCREIEGFTERFGNSYEDYIKDSAYRRACGMSLMQIGELVSKLPDDFRNKNKEIPWVKIRGMRNIFAHNYGDVNEDIIWTTIAERLPELRTFCENKLQDM